MIARIFTTFCAFVIIFVIAAGCIVRCLRIFGFEPMAVRSVGAHSPYRAGDLAFINTKAGIEDLKMGDDAVFRGNDAEKKVLLMDGKARFFQILESDGYISDIDVSFVGKAAFSLPMLGKALNSFALMEGLAVSFISAGAFVALIITPMAHLKVRMKISDKRHCA
ncbi:MAG: hypothetical protein LBU32_29345 [Clostridiales bacterium]|jgi:hypothetical protein|nr:hypothetical protein [Clostridiales bacterium]